MPFTPAFPHSFTIHIHICAAHRTAAAQTSLKSSASASMTKITLNACLKPPRWHTRGTSRRPNRQAPTKKKLHATLVHALLERICCMIHLEATYIHTTPIKSANSHSLRRKVMPVKSRTGMATLVAFPLGCHLKNPHNNLFRKPVCASCISSWVIFSNRRRARCLRCDMLWEHTRTARCGRQTMGNT